MFGDTCTLDCFNGSDCGIVQQRSGCGRCISDCYRLCAAGGWKNILLKSLNEQIISIFTYE